MNRGLIGFPTRDSVVTSVDPYMPLEDGGYVLAAESTLRGSLMCISATAEGAFPITYGALPPGGTAGAIYGSATTVTGSLSGMRKVSVSGGPTGEAVVGYSTLVDGLGTPEDVQSLSGASVARIRACALAGGNYVVTYTQDTTLYNEIRNSAGVTVTNATTCATVQNASYQYGCAALANGDYAVTYYRSGALYFLVRGPTGSLVVSETGPTLIGTPDDVTDVVGLLGGGFVFAYSNQASGASDLYVAICLPDNTYFASQLIASGTLGAGASSNVAMASLSSGGYVVAWTAAGGSQPHFRVLDSSHGYVTDVTSVAAEWATSIAVTGLNNGGFVVAHTTSTAVKYARFNAAGVLQGSVTAIASVTASDVDVKTMPSGDFVITYNDFTTSVLAVKLNPANTVLSGPTIVEAVNTNGAGLAVACLQTNINVFVYTSGVTAIRQTLSSFSGTSSFQRYSSSGTTQGPLTAVVSNPTRASASARLVGGSFVYAYTTINNVPAFTVWSRTGVVQVTETLPEAVYSRWISVSALPNGGFVLAWESLYGALVRFGRYSAAGALQGALTTVEATTAASGSVTGLRDGTFALGYLNASGAPRFAIFDTTGTQTAAPATLEAVTATWIETSGLSTGDVVFTYNPSGPSVKYIIKTSTGAAKVSATTVESVTNTTGSVCALPGGDFAVAYNNSTTNLRYGRYSAAGVLQGSLGTVEAKSVSSVACGALNNGDLWIAYANATDSDVRFVRYGSSAVVLGVADRDAAPGETLAVRTSGMFTLRENWGAPAVFDHSTATPVRGNRGTIFGKTATLNGV